MATPTVTLNTQRPDLATFWQASWAEIEGDFISSRALPTINPAKQAGNFGRKTLESIARHDADLDRAPGSGYKRRRYEFEQDSYTTTEKGVEEVVDDRERDMYIDYTVAEEFAVQRAIHSVLIERERRASTTIFDTAYYLADANLNQTVATPWDQATSTPIVDVEAAVRKVRNNTGLTPNALIIPYYSFRDLRNHADIIARVAALGAGDRNRARDVNIGHLQAIFDIENILVGDTMRNTANVGQTAVMADVWPGHGLVTRIANSSDFSEPCLGRTIHWSADGSMIDGMVESYREENIRSAIYRARHDYQQKILYKDLACLLPTIRT